MSINVNDKNLGHATAYAYYKAGGGTMTEAEFTEFMADFGTASQTAVEAAQAALASKNAAQTAATTATNKASEATTAAQTATTKAGEASTSASTATSAKDTAVSASQTATTKATEATTAAATATSAKTDAVAANTAAQSAKTAAQTAQTGAETAAASVAESAAQIQTNAEDISQLKSNFADIESDGVVPSAEQILTDKGVTDSVPYRFRKTGGDGADRLYDQIVGVTVCFNQLVSNNVIHGTINSGMSATDLQSAQLKANHKYLYQLNLSRQSTGGDQNVDFQIALRFFGGATAIYHFDQSSKPHVVTVDSTQFSSLTSYTYSDTFGNDVTYALNLFDLTAMFGSTIADYIYSLEQSTAGAGVAFFKKLFPKDYYEYNEGELKSVEGVSAHKTVGFNQWDEEWENGRINVTTGALIVDSTHLRSKNYIRVISETNYYAKTTNAGYVVFYDANHSCIGNEYIDAGGKSFATPNNCVYAKFFVTTSTYNHDICINLSDPAKNGTYEPYKAHSYPLDSTLTLRGLFKLDANSNLYADGDTYDADGTVTRKRRRIVIDGNTYKAISVSLNNGVYYTVINAFTSDTRAVDSNTATKRIITNAGYNDYPAVGIGNIYITGSGLTTVICLFDQTLTDMTSVNNYFASHPIVMEYELATPTTEEADPYQHLQQCDPNGTEEYVSTGIVPVGHNSFYPENLKSKIEGLPWNFASLIAPTEATFTATRNYTTGALFIVDNVLYKATSNIANGGTITPNTNCAATTLAEIISALA